MPSAVYSIRDSKESATTLSLVKRSIPLPPEAVGNSIVATRAQWAGRHGRRGSLAGDGLGRADERHLSGSGAARFDLGAGDLFDVFPNRGNVSLRNLGYFG
jgi:hypothetical protein